MLRNVCLAFVLAGLVASGVLAVVAIPRAVDAREDRREPVATAHAELTSAREALEAAQTASPEAVAELAARDQALHVLLPEAIDSAGITRELTTAVGSSAAVLEVLRIDGPEPQDGGYQVVTINLRVQGSIEAIELLAAAITAIPRYYTIDELEVEPAPAAGTDATTLTGRLELRTFAWEGAP